MRLALPSLIAIAAMSSGVKSEENTSEIEKTDLKEYDFFNRIVDFIDSSKSFEAKSQNLSAEAIKETLESLPEGQILDDIYDEAVNMLNNKSDIENDSVYGKSVEQKNVDFENVSNEEDGTKEGDEVNKEAWKEKEEGTSSQMEMSISDEESLGDVNAESDDQFEGIQESELADNNADALSDSEESNSESNEQGTDLSEITGSIQNIKKKKSSSSTTTNSNKGIHAGIYFNIDKDEEVDEDENCKGFWFWPFSTDMPAPEARERVQIASKILLSPAHNNTGGLFKIVQQEDRVVEPSEAFEQQSLNLEHQENVSNSNRPKRKIVKKIRVKKPSNATDYNANNATIFCENSVGTSRHAVTFWLALSLLISIF